MPWSKDKTITSLENKSDKVKEVFAEAANAALSRGLSEEDAVFAGLGAVSRYEKANKPLKKSLKPELPIHVKAILEARKQKEQEELENLKKAALELEEKREVESPKVLKAFLPENAIEPNPERSLVAAEWDKQGRLILTFDDGEKITTSPVPVQEKIEQYIGVSYGQKLDGIDNIQLTESTGYAKWNGSSWVLVNETYLQSYTETDPVFQLARLVELLLQIFQTGIQRFLGVITQQQAIRHNLFRVSTLKQLTETPCLARVTW